MLIKEIDIDDDPLILEIQEAYETQDTERLLQALNYTSEDLYIEGVPYWEASLYDYKSSKKTFSWTIPIKGKKKRRDKNTNIDDSSS